MNTLLIGRRKLFTLDKSIRIISRIPILKKTVFGHHRVPGTFLTHAFTAMSGIAEWVPKGCRRAVCAFE